MTKQVTNKVPNYVENGIKNELRRSDLFDPFEGLVPEAPQGGPKDPPEHPPASNLVQNGPKQRCPKRYFYKVLESLVPD